MTVCDRVIRLLQKTKEVSKLYFLQERTHTGADHLERVWQGRREGKKVTVVFLNRHMKRKPLLANKKDTNHNLDPRWSAPT